jgi:putative spermidine/putrescine transport system permease protein
MSTSRRDPFQRVLELSFYGVVAITVAFLLAPLFAVAVLSFQSNPYLVWPPESFTLEWYTSIPGNLGYLGLPPAVVASVRLAVATAIVSTVFGTLAAFGLDRYEVRYSTSIETLLLSPLIYPWLVVGIAILLLIGQINSLLGIGITLSFWTVLMGHVLVTLPYPARTVLANLSNFDHSLEEAAQNLGASELETYARITLPLIRPGAISGLLFAFILSWNNYIVTLFLTSTDLQTVPLLLFTLFRNNPPAQLAAIGTVFMMSIMIVVTIAEFTMGVSEYL